jgi:hypothetical protein
MNAELRDLQREAYALPVGDGRIEALERAVARADQLGDVDAGFDLRDDLSEAANAWGRPEKELVAFTWMLAQYDRDPERFSDWEYKLMWTYKRVLATLASFPSIPVARMDAAFADFETRLERSGRSPSTHDEFRLRNALLIGDPHGVETAYRAFKTHARAADLDCRACQMHLEVRYRLFAGEDEAAVRAAQALFKRGAPRCNRVPHATHAFVLLPLLRLGRPLETIEHHRNYRLIASDESFLPAIALHLEYLGYLNDMPGAIKLLERHLGWVYHTNDLDDRYGFLRAALPLLERLKRAGGMVRLRFGRDVPFVNDSGEYDPAVLETTFNTELTHFAALFDARNGNDYYSRRIAVDHALLERYAEPFAPPESADKQAVKKKKPRVNEN